jgi:hypothetical protein
MRMLLDENVQTRSDISSALPFALNDISELTGLPLEAFNRQINGSVISLKSRFQPETQSDSPSESTDTTNVFEFRRKG